MGRDAETLPRDQETGPEGASDLLIEDLTVRFGGLTAVEGLDLGAAARRITGLIGPNGAGKTTTFDAATGLVDPARGSVRLGAEVLDGTSPSRRAQRGLGRTFQRMRLFDTMTVAQNVAMGPEAWFAGRRPWGQVFGSADERDEVERRTEEALDRCEIDHLRDERAGDLSTGQRRLVEFARALATGFRFLLLDEPSSGLDEEETERFAELLVEVSRERGTGVLLVEHDMALVRLVCGYVYVLEFGRLIYEGATEDVLASDRVRAAYLGREAV